MGVESLDRLEAPSLALAPFFLGPHNPLPVGRENEPRTCIGKLDPIAGRLPDVKKERLLDGVLVRAGFDVNAVFQENISGLQNMLALIHRVSDVMKSSVAVCEIACVGHVIRFIVLREPAAAERAVIELNDFGDAA